MKSYKKTAKDFIDKLEYTKEPYNSKSWGHPWHSLCSYHGKLKPAIAHLLVKEFSNPGDKILDPMCGVGTIPFEACLQGRIGIGNDLSEMAYVVTKSKLEKIDINKVKCALNDLKKFIEKYKDTELIKNEIVTNKNFGFNGKVETYFHKDTYKELLAARLYFGSRIKKITAAESIVLSCLLHVLHGNRPYALSRKSHPLTPYAPTGDFEYKNVIEHINDKIELSYKKADFKDYIKGKAILGDYYDIAKKNIEVDLIITSPPFADSMRFYMQNWMRLWFCGWDIDRFNNADTEFIDKKQISDFDIYFSFFDMCYKVLKPNGKIIMHLGKTKKIDMANEISIRAKKSFSIVHVGTENVNRIEKHGVKDKGTTVAHQFLFLQKK